MDREEQGQTLSRLLPSGLASRISADHFALDRTDDLEVSVLMSDVRGYSGIAEITTPSDLAQQLGEHRNVMNGAILGVGGTVMQYVGDAVMAVFGAPEPQPEHARRALEAAAAMHQGQAELNERWSAQGRAAFGLGIGISTGRVTAAALGSAERVEYTLVGDTVNLAQRLQDLARPAGTTVASGPTIDAITAGGRSNGPGAPDALLVGWEQLPDSLVKGRVSPVRAFRLSPDIVTLNASSGGSR